METKGKSTIYEHRWGYVESICKRTNLFCRQFTFTVQNFKDYALRTNLRHVLFFETVLLHEKAKHHRAARLRLAEMLLLVGVDQCAQRIASRTADGVHLFQPH